MRIKQSKEPWVGSCLRHVSEKSGCAVNSRILSRFNSLDFQPDLEVTVDGPNQQRRIYSAVVKPHLQDVHVSHFLSLYIQSKKQFPLLVLSRYINPHLGQKMADLKIQFADSLGNMFLEPWKGSMIMFLTPRPRPLVLVTKSFFHFAGAKIVFAVLAHRKERLTVRKLADLAGVSFAMAAMTLKSLKEQGKIAEQDKIFQLISDSDILENWLASYKIYMRPRLLMGRFRFPSMDPADFIEKLTDVWKERNFNYAITGDFAANLYTRSLLGGNLTCFLDKDSLEMVVDKLKMLPTNEEEGVELLDFFGPAVKDDPYASIAHPLLVYAELLNGGTDRQREAAQVIYEQHIKKIL